MDNKNNRNWMSPHMFMEFSSLGKKTIYKYVAEGLIPHVRIGHRILIPSDAFDHMLLNKPK